MSKFKILKQSFTKQKEQDLENNSKNKKKDNDGDSECSVNTNELLANCDLESSDQEDKIYETSPVLKNELSNLDLQEIQDNMQSSPLLCDFKFYENSSHKSEEKEPEFGKLTDLKQTLQFVNKEVKEEIKASEDQLAAIDKIMETSVDRENQTKQNATPQKIQPNKQEVQSKLKLLKSK